MQVVEVEEDLPKFLIVGESEIAIALARNLLSGGCRVFFLNDRADISAPNLYKISREQISRISQEIQYILFDKEPNYRLEFEIKEHLPNSKLIYLNPRSIKEQSYMLFSPFIYGPGITDHSFGFLALNEKNIIEERILIFPENIDQDIRPIFVADVVEIIEKIMFSRPPENLILLYGKETISLIRFLGNLKARIKINLQAKYLEQKLTFRLPRAGRVETGTTPLEKGIIETANFLNAAIISFEPKQKPAPSLPTNPVPPSPSPFFPPQREKVIATPPKHIPMVNQLGEEDETDFALNNNFIKRVYHQNLEYLKQNDLYGASRKKDLAKSAEKSFAAKINYKWERLNQLMKKVKNFRPKIHGDKDTKIGPLFKKIVFLILTSIFIAAFPYLMFMVSISASLFFLKQSGESFANYNFSQSSKFLSLGNVSLKIGKFLNNNLIKYYYFAANKPEAYKNIGLLIDLEEKSGLILKNSQNVFSSVSTTLPFVLDQKERDLDIDSQLQDMAVAITTAKGDLSSTVAALKHEIPHLPWFLKFKNNEYYSFINKFPIFYQEINQAEAVFREIPTILGKNEKKTYAILFQNNMELRATGGFIGSFALMSFEKEKLTDFSVFDVYDADGQLKGKVAPPPEILHYLGQPDWFLRDSNVSPDFPTFAPQAEWFLEKEMMAKVDGVFAIDISFAESLLNITGPISLPDYKETVNSQNLFEKAEKQAEQEYFPGSKNKKDYLGSLGREMWNKVLSLPKNDFVKLFKLMKDAGEKRHLQVYFNEDSLQKLSLMYKLDGSFISGKKQYLNIVENNYGANKANYFVKRDIFHVVHLLPDGFVEQNLKIQYENLSPLAMWPTGIYKPYVKVYMNRDTLFKDLEFQGKKAKLSDFLNEFVLKDLKPTEQLVLQGEENDKQYFGTFFEIPISARREINLSYQSKTADISNLKNFELYLQKQAGVVGDNYHLTVLFPDALAAKSNLPASLAARGKLEYNLNTEKDIDLKINFQ